MSSLAQDTARPEPFRFAPATGPTADGAAFSWFFKTLSGAITLASAAWAAHLLLRGQVAGTGSTFAWFLAAQAMLVYLWVCILRSRTRIDETRIVQTWPWSKSMAVADLASARLVRVAGLDWLVAPRLYARDLAGKLVVFYVADPELIADCERMAAQVKAFRRL